jgi:RNA polymerase sigma-70 factor, ECF subfamily
MDAATKLALRAADGDRASLDAWIEFCYRPVWRYCATMISADRADELAQDTFERALRALPTFRGRSAATTWLIGIARHVCIDQLRADRRRDQAHQQIAALRPPNRAAEAADRTLLLDLISRLGHDRREAFVLTQLLGFSYEEAARICSCPVGTIRSRLARARTELLAGNEGAEDVARRRTGPTT